MNERPESIPDSSGLSDVHEELAAVSAAFMLHRRQQRARQRTVGAMDRG